MFAALTFALSIVRFLDGDELEHVHSAWYVLNGALPYVDFFEHHHPLLWYLLAPALALTGESANAVVVLRLGFFLLVRPPPGRPTASPSSAGRRARPRGSACSCCCR